MVNFCEHSSYQSRNSLVKSFNRIAFHIVILVCASVLLIAVENKLELLNVECKDVGKLVLNFSMPVKVSRKHGSRCLLYAWPVICK